MEIMGVKPEPKPSAAAPIETSEPSPSPEKPTPSQAVADAASSAAPVTAPTKTAIAQGSPLDDEKGDGECNLLGDFALLVQGALGLLAVSSLAVKRWREHPRRPVKIWFFDASKQVFGSVLLHLANVLMSMLSSGKFDVATTTNATPPASAEGDQPNPCSFYLLNLAIDVSCISIRLTIVFSNQNRQQSAFLSSFSFSRSYTAALSSHPSLIHPNLSALATMVTRPALPGGSSNP
jgi:hypothetical protein